ncbi:MAG: hypothetical protein DME25_19270 [Verrucomicrobia bacterium]|nr:MAG: hypothetical protein DME25_19270 [Verrucomicrobiota bacterium]
MAQNQSAADTIAPFPPGVTLTTLDNGLILIVREDHSAPVVSAQAWCMAGSIHEGKWLGAGLSHVLEHMLFKGTTTRPGSRIDQEVQEAGGYMNAYTSFDRTVFHIDVPNTGAKVALDILCDIMQNATLPSDELAKEKDVIVREMDMNVRVREKLGLAYFVGAQNFVGLAPGCFAFYVGTAPEKAELVERELLAEAELLRTEGLTAEELKRAKAKARAIPPIVLPEEPRQTAPREIIEEAPIELGHFHFAWHIPELRHPDVPALEVLAVLLGHGRSSRLYQQVREKQGLVNSVDAWTYSPANSGLFGLSAVVDADKFSPAREAMLAEIERMKDGSVSTAELGKVVKQIVSAVLSARKTMQGQAQDLGGSWLAANDLNFSERYLAAIKRVTLADLQRVARDYLTPETLYALLPAGTAPKPVSAGETTCDHAVQKFELPNGLRLLLKEDHRLPFVEMRAVFKGGVLAETAEKGGLTQLTGNLLLKGTPKRSAEEIAKEIESVGGSLDSYGGNNSFGVNAEVLSSDFATGLDLVADVLLHPTFPAPALERERQVQLAAIRAQKDQLLQSASKAMRRALFGDTGYGLDVLVTEASVQRIQVADLKAFHETLARPNNCVLAIYGDIKTVEARTAVEQAFASWKPAPDDSLALNIRPQTLGSVKRVTETRDKKQAVLVIGFPGTTLFDADRYALELVQERVREKLGLAYFVGAQNFVGLAPGCFAFYVGTAPEKAELVERELLAEAELLRTEGLTAEELKRAKAKVIGQKKIARQDLGSFAMATALDELYGLGYAHVDVEDALFEAVSLEQVKTAAQKYLKPNALVIAVVKPPDGNAGGRKPEPEGSSKAE